MAKVCEPCAFDVCPLSQITLVSTTGGLACGADGVCVRFPAGALPGVTEIEVTRTDNPVSFIGANSISKIYSIRPAGLTPAMPVEIVMPVSRRLPDNSAPVFILHALGPRGPWESLDTTRELTRASAFSPLLGLFVLAQDASPPPRDGGVEPRADAGQPDAMVPDAGPPPLMDPIPGVAAATAIPGPFTTLHGLAWDTALNRMLLTESMESVIVAVPHTGAVTGMPTVVRTMANNPFGVAAGPGGQVLVMERGTRSITTLVGGGAVPFIESFGGQAFNGPADAAIRGDGTVYFTDPGSGLAGRPRAIQFNGVFRRAPNGTVTADYEGSMMSDPRGIELSPDESTLYVVERSARAVLAWSVAADGTLGGQRVFASTSPDPDGIAVDRIGNVYVGTSQGIDVLAPDGTRWGAIPAAGAVGGLAFGGPMLGFLYSATPTTLYYQRVTVTGAR